MRTLIMKFGGLSVGTTTALTQVLSIILNERERWDNLIIVVSALEGVTDALVEATRLAQISNRRGYRRIAATLRTRHLALIEHLPMSNTERQAIQADIDRLLFEMLDELQSLADTAAKELSSAAVDSIIGVGERLAARIVAALVRQNNIRAVALDSSGLIITDDTFGNAAPLIGQSCERIQRNLLPMLERSIVPIVTGFIGSTPDGRPTTLGRGGSDYTASVLALCADADALWIWTDVDGMMTTDPHDIDAARVIPHMSYHEVGEMAYFGARVLHAHMIGPLKQGGIPLHIKNVFKPQQVGTAIQDIPQNKVGDLKAVTQIQGIGLTANQSGPLSGITAIVNDVLAGTAGSPAEVMISSQSSNRTFLCFIVPTTSGPDAARSSVHVLQDILAARDLSAAWDVKPVSVITVIGSNLNQQPSAAAAVLSQIKDVPLLALAQGPSNCSLSVVVNPDNAPYALRRLHDLLVFDA